MKYLKKFFEASKSVNDYKFRRDILPSEIEDILFPLKDEFIKYHITFSSTDMKNIEIDFKSKDPISKDVFADTLGHLINYLISEKFELVYFRIDYENGGDITTPEFSTQKFIDLIPKEFSYLELIFRQS